jgi:Putative auto-transporter adhesin, head GIN domain
MNRVPILASFLLVLPASAIAATRSYETAAFESVSAAAGVEVQITVGTPRSVVAETQSNDFDDLRIEVRGNVLRIDRPRGWWIFSRRPNYSVRIVTPALRSVTASSGSDVVVKADSLGDFAVNASSGSAVQVTLARAGTIKASASSGSELAISGACTALEVETSSGSEVDAGKLNCETVKVQASSGSEASVFASRSVMGKASSGSDVQIGGAPPVVQVDRSSGADVSLTR